MTEAQPEKTEVRGYSMPKAMHARIAREAKARDVSASKFVRMSVVHYLKWLRGDSGGEEVA